MEAVFPVFLSPCTSTFSCSPYDSLSALRRTKPEDPISLFFICKREGDELASWLQKSEGTHTAFLLKKSELKIYAEDETRETHQAIHEFEDMTHNINGDIGLEENVLTFVSELNCVSSMQTRRSAPSYDWETAAMTTLL